MVSRDSEQASEGFCQRLRTEHLIALLFAGIAIHLRGFLLSTAPRTREFVHRNGWQWTASYLCIATRRVYSHESSAFKLLPVLGKCVVQRLTGILPQDWAEKWGFRTEYRDVIKPIGEDGSRGRPERREFTKEKARL